MWRFLAVLLMSFVLAIKGFYFHTELDPARVIKAKADVTPKCLKHSENVNCKFYKCLDERFPCHPERKKQDTSYRQCRRALNVAKTLNDIGKIWINSIIGCFMNELTDMYKSDTLDCNSILEKTLAIQHTCYMKNDFCEVGWDNREGLWQIFKRPIEKSKSQHYKALWENIGKISSKCTSENAPKLTAWINAKAGESLTN
ncbi:uncharacterized protein LOC115224535 [Octopus sinensis]|uniref:Uncharacterized protein LOC115224535 n=1 Tax=Octopus sinensis TaxID=2607531 RepID=A0A6P7TMW0_9MOLL|nr:uncharacterized protein LOC115224535 [Octopus sinensis]